MGDSIAPLFGVAVSTLQCDFQLFLYTKTCTNRLAEKNGTYYYIYYFDYFFYLFFYIIIKYIIILIIIFSHFVPRPPPPPSLAP